jgi:uncharacterized protein YjdB
MKINAPILCACLFMALAATSGCTVSTNDAVDDGKAIASVNVGPSTTTMTTGTKTQFTATLEYADGTTRAVTSDSGTVWNSSNASIATVSSTGVVSAIKVGVVTISAEFDTVKGDQEFAVTP